MPSAGGSASCGTRVTLAERVVLDSYFDHVLGYLAAQAVNSGKLDGLVWLAVVLEHHGVATWPREVLHLHSLAATRTVSGPSAVPF